MRIRNHFTGVNGLFDQMAMQGRVGYISLSAPFDLGVEAVGIIEAVGEDVIYCVGDTVATTYFVSGYRHRQVITVDKVYQSLK